MRIIVLLVALAAVSQAGATSSPTPLARRMASGTGAGSSEQGTSRQGNKDDEAAARRGAERLWGGPIQPPADQSSPEAGQRCSGGSSGSRSAAETDVAHEQMARLGLGKPGPATQPSDPRRPSEKPWQAAGLESARASSAKGQFRGRPSTNEELTKELTGMVGVINAQKEKGYHDYYQRKSKEAPDDVRLQTLASIEHALASWQSNMKILNEGRKNPRSPLSKKEERTKLAAIERMLPQISRGTPEFAQKLQKMVDAARDPKRKQANTGYQLHDLTAALEKEEGPQRHKFLMTSKYDVERAPVRERLAQEVKDRKWRKEMMKQGMSGEQYSHVLAEEPTRKREGLQKEFEQEVYGKDATAANKAAGDAKERSKTPKAPISKAELQQKAQGHQQAESGAQETVGKQEDTSHADLEKARRKKEKLQQKYARKREKKQKEQHQEAESLGERPQDAAEDPSGTRSLT